METNRIQDKKITGIDKTAFISPRQRARAYGVGENSYERTETGERIFDKATQLMGFFMPRLYFEENDRLDITEYTQAAMVTTSIAMMRALEEDGIRPNVTAGLGLGEYCALTAAGVMSDGDAIWTVHQRRILMQEAVPVGEGTMAAILALDVAAIEEMTGAMEDVWIANYNYPKQIVISGEETAVEETCEKLKVTGAKRAVMLNVNGLPHSGMLTTTGEELEQVLSRVELHGPRIPYVANATAQYVKSAAEVKELLAGQVSSSVRWQQSVEAMIGGDAGAFIEIGPGKALAGFMRRIGRDVKTLNVEKLEDIGKATGALKS